MTETDKPYNFWSYSPINVHRCGNIYYIFGQVHHVNVRHCQLFGQVHQFRSYSSGHLDSVKWLTLKNITMFLLKSVPWTPWKTINVSQNKKSSISINVQACAKDLYKISNLQQLKFFFTFFIILKLSDIKKK